MYTLSTLEMKWCICHISTPMGGGGFNFYKADSFGMKQKPKILNEINRVQILYKAHWIRHGITCTSICTIAV